MGFGNFWVYGFGTVLSPVKIVGLWSLIYGVSASNSWARRFTGTKRGIFMLLLFWFVVACLLGYALPVPAAVANSWGVQGVALRPLSQLVTYSAALSFVPLAFAASRIQGAWLRVMGIYSIAVAFDCIVASYQFYALKMGLYFMPIYRAIGGSNDVAAFSAGEDVVYRLYAFAQEPKQLGMFLTPFVIMGIILSLERNDRLQVWWNKRYLFAFVALIDILTYSTAVLLALGIATIFAVSWSLRGYIRTLAFILTLTLIAGFMATPSEKASRSAAEYSGGIGELLYSRSVGRIQEEASERMESKALRLVTVEHPENFFVGVGLGMYVYLIEGAFFGNGVEPINSGWVTLLMDVGAIGVFLVILAISTAAIPALRAARVCSPRDSLILRGIVAALMGSCALDLGTAAFVAMMMWLGVTLAANGFISGAGTPGNSLANAKRRPKAAAGQRLATHSTGRGF